MGKAFLRRVAGGLGLSKLGKTTAGVAQVLSGYTFYSKDKTLKTGTISSKAAATYGAKTSDQTISAGQYLSGAQTIKKVEQTNLSAANIIKGKTVTIKSNGTNLWNITGKATSISDNGSTIYYLNGTSRCTETGAWWIYPGETADFVTGDGCLTLTETDSGYCTMQKAVDLTNIKSITATYQSSNIDHWLTGHAGIKISANATDAQTVYEVRSLVSSTNKVTVTLDTSSLTGVHFLRAVGFEGTTMSFYSIYGTYA